MQECGLNYPEIIKRFLTRPPSPVSAEWIFRLKEIVFYNLFIYLFNIIEILIKKIILFFFNLRIVHPSFLGTGGMETFFTKNTNNKMEWTLLTLRTQRTVKLNKNGKI